VYVSIPYVEMTDEGMNYLRTICAMYQRNEVSVDDILRNFKKISDDFSGYEDMVDDALFDNFYKIMN
jgi:hypothetical protein